MKLLIVSSAPFIYKENQPFAYAPYVEELELWEKNSDEISFCCPIWQEPNGLLISAIAFPIQKHFRILDFNIKSPISILKALYSSFYNLLVLFRAMYQADHIHLRCPGNIGLLAAFVQLFFPYKRKTAKYAGNWDPKAKQPLSYRLQQWLLSNERLTRNMQVLVYGRWDAMSRNIKSFFTASYWEDEKQPLEHLHAAPTNFVFAGMLVEGKNPLYAIQIVEALHKSFDSVTLHLYGDGPLRFELNAYISEKELGNFIFLKGNQDKEVIKDAYQNNHFVILPSQSEGWPKAIAEGMFWGCVPISTSVSCLPWMLEDGKRGVLLSGNLSKDVAAISQIITNREKYTMMRTSSAEWSRDFTLDVFASEIKQLLQQ